MDFKLMIKTLRYFYKIAWSQRPLYFLLILFQILIDSLSPFVNILFPAFIIDELLGDQSIPQLTTYVAIIVLGNAFFAVSRKIVVENIYKFDDTFDKLFDQNISMQAMTMDFEHTENPEVGNQVEKATTGMSWYSGGISGLTSCMVNILSSVISLIGVTAIIINSSPILLGVIIFSVIISVFINAKINQISIIFFERLVPLNRAFGYIFFEMPSIRYGKDIRLYGASDMVYQKGVTSNNLTTKEWGEQGKAQYKLSQVDIFVNCIRDGITYFYLAYQAIKRIISIGNFTMLITSASTFTNSLKNIIYNIQELSKKSKFMNEYVIFMEYPNQLKIGHEPVKDIKHVIEFKNVSFKYPRSDHYVLKEINVTILPNEHISVVGLNGAGKTTFIKLLCRLYEVTEGEILLDGININDYEYEEYQKIFSVVFQDFKLLAFNLRENIALDKMDDEQVIQDLELAGLKERLKSLDKGLDTSVYKDFDKNGVEFSGGEAQKMAIARALYKDSQIVILDEPTAALDPIAEYEIYSKFNSLIGGKTAIYISHRLSSCKFCDRIIVFSENKIVESGTHEELIQLTNGVYQTMFNAQAQYYK